MSHILDDFLFFGHPGTNECLKGIQSFLQFTQSVGLPVKQEKTVWPSTHVEMHGIMFDSTTMTLSLPLDKVSKAHELIDSCFKKRKVRAIVIQQIHGLLNFACRAVPPGRTFLRRIANLLKGVTSNAHFIRLNKEARKDLQAWKYFLSNFNCAPIMLPIQWSLDVDWKLFSDASGRGYAGIFGSHWVAGEFPDSWQDKSIAVKELAPIYITFTFWVKLLANSKILFLMDNYSVVHVLRSKTSRDPILMGMIRKMVVLSMLHNITFSANHIVGKHNVISDLISTFQVEKARELAPWLDEQPTKIPRGFLPWCNRTLT